VGLAWSESPVCSASDTHTVTLTILVTLGLIMVIGHRGKDCHCYCCYLPLSMGIIDSGNFSSGGLVAVSVNRHFGWVRKFDFFIGLRLFEMVYTACVGRNIADIVHRASSVWAAWVGFSVYDCAAAPSVHQ